MNSCKYECGTIMRCKRTLESKPCEKFTELLSTQCSIENKPAESDRLQLSESLAIGAEDSFYGKK